MRHFRGTVHHAFGAVIPSASAVLIYLGTAAEVRTTTNDDGRYVFPRTR